MQIKFAKSSCILSILKMNGGSRSRIPLNVGVSLGGSDPGSRLTFFEFPESRQLVALIVEIIFPFSRTYFGPFPHPAGTLFPFSRVLFINFPDPVQQKIANPVSRLDPNETHSQVPSNFMIKSQVHFSFLVRSTFSISMSNDVTKYQVQA